MEMRVIGPTYTQRNVRCEFCNKPIQRSAAICDILVPSQEDLGVDIREYVGKAHNGCIEAKGLKREV